MDTITAFLKRNPFLAAAVLFCFVAGLFLLFGTGCAQNIYVTPDHKTVDHGTANTVQFQAKDGSGKTIQGVTWSCDPSVGTVTASGLFTATGWGTCNVTASKSGYQSGSAQVQVPTYLSGTLSSSKTLTKQYNPYILSGTVVVPTGVTLTINPGTVVKAKPGAMLQVEGTLTSVGTSGEPISFTSFKDDSVWGDTNDDGSATSPAKGDWSKIYIKANAQSSRVEFTNVSYAGNAVSIDGGSHQIKNCQFKEMSSDGISVGGGVQTITNNTIKGCTGTAISLGSVSPNNVRNNTGSGNGTNGIGVWGTYDGDYTWNSSNTNLPYYINPHAAPTYGSVIIPLGKTLTIEHGVVVKGTNWDACYAPSRIDVEGKLLSQGTADDPVCFTSISDDSVWGDTNNNGPSSGSPGNWGGLILKNATQPSQLLYTRIRYGGYTHGGAGFTPGLTITGGSQQVSHCRLSDMGGAGAVSISGGNPQIKDNTEIAGPVVISGGNPTISNCDVSVGTLWISGGTPTVTGCDIHDVAGDGMSASGGSSNITGCNIHDVTGNGVSVSGGNVAITSCQVHHTNGDGMTATSGTLVAMDCNIHNSGDGIDVSTAATPTITSNSIEDCSGTAITLGSTPPNNVRNNTGSRNTVNGISVWGTYNAVASWGVNPNLPFAIDNSGLTVPSGKTLTIESGVVVKGSISTGAKLTVNGILLSQGTSSNSVNFTSFKDDTIGGNTDNSSAQPSRGDWGGIDLKNASDVSSLSYTNIRYAGSGIAGLLIEAGFHQVSHCYLSDMGSSGTLTVKDGNPQITYSEILGPVDLQMGSATVSNCHIHDTNSFGMKALIGNPTISNCNIHDLNDYGIKSTADNPTITGNTIVDFKNYGIYVSASTNATVTHNTIEGFEGLGTGLYLSSVYGQVTYNDIAWCGCGVQIGYECLGVNISENNIYDNFDCGLDGGAQVQLQVSGNWWGDSNGPSPCGFGNQVIGDVTPVPWLTEGAHGAGGGEAPQGEWAKDSREYSDSQDNFTLDGKVYYLTRGNMRKIVGISTFYGVPASAAYNIVTFCASVRMCISPNNTTCPPDPDKSVFGPSLPAPCENYETRQIATMRPDITDTVGFIYVSVGMGHYSLELDAISAIETIIELYTGVPLGEFDEVYNFASSILGNFPIGWEGQF